MYLNKTIEQKIFICGNIIEIFDFFPFSLKISQNSVKLPLF